LVNIVKLNLCKILKFVLKDSKGNFLINKEI
jgi:hypothetical protein